ncbi:MAG TPA: hypothetical protein VKD72_18725 [Gemmataceae bacterium]|nr:hypothetical protein [Gemmataceae bacterium]
MTGLTSPALAGTPVAPTREPAGCGLRAFGIVHANPATIAALRQKPGPPSIVPDHFRPHLLKHSDEQTVASLAAVLDAIHRFGLSGHDFTAWGVVAAPRWLGRPKAAAAFNKFHREGFSRASPMAVPHLSLHAVSGTISQTLRIQGPSFGTGSGAGHLAEGLLAALSLVSEGELPGLWLTLSRWDPEPAPDVQGEVSSECVCHAVALALVPVAANFTGPRLRLLPPAPVPGEQHEPASVQSLADFLAGSAPAGSWVCPLGWGGWVELTGTPSQRNAAGNEALAEALP